MVNYILINLEKVAIGFGSLKSKVYKLDVDNFVPVSADLKKLSDVVDKEVVKTDVYHKFIKKVNAIHNTDASDLVLNA